jgi:hypothetical protein
MEKFIVTKLPVRTIATVDGSPMLKDVEYDMALESTVVFENPNSYKGEPFDSLTYKVTKDDIHTINEGLVVIDFRTDKTKNPVLSNKTQELNIDESIFFSDIIAPQDVFDRIEIVSIDGKGSWKLSGSPLIVGSIIMWYNLVDLLLFKADTSGSKNNYNTMTWKYANKIKTFPGINTLKFNVKSLAKLLFLEVNELEQETTSLVKQFSFLFTIENGPENGIFMFDINTTEFTGFATNPLNVFTLNQDNTMGILYNLPEPSIAVLSSLNEFGKTNYELIVSIDKTYTAENKLKLSLTTVNDNPALIDPLLKEINLIIPKP